MAFINFPFIKERTFGDLISDFLSLFKQIFKHFNKVTFLFILPFLALFLVLFFFSSTLVVEILGQRSVYFADSGHIALLIISGLLLIFAYFVFIPTFGIEYMFLLQERGATDFSANDVWKRVRGHFKKYITFFFASILVALILSIPILLAFVILAFIPLLGSLAIGFLSSCLSVVAVCALFLYLKNRATVFESFTMAFSLLKKKFFIYGLAAYIFRLMLTVCIGFVVLIPGIILGVVAYLYIGFNEAMFSTFMGKLLLSIGGSLFMVLSTVTTLYTMSFYTLIYNSSLETTNKEGTLLEIDQIGQNGNATNEA